MRCLIICNRRTTTRTSSSRWAYFVSDSFHSLTDFIHQDHPGGPELQEDRHLEVHHEDLPEGHQQDHLADHPEDLLVVLHLQDPQEVHHEDRLADLQDHPVDHREDHLVRL
jgi:hypothetical protein